MIEIEYDITSKTVLQLGKQWEHCKTVVFFTGYEKVDPDSELYLSVHGVGNFKLIGMQSVPIVQNITKNHGRVKMEILEYKRDPESNGVALIAKSDIFYGEVTRSLNETNDIVPEAQDIKTWLAEFIEYYIEQHKQPYASIERLGSYIFKVTFDLLPNERPTDFASIFGCSSFVKDGKLHRNFDWDYTEDQTFWIKCNGFEGISFGSALNDDDISKLPYQLVDGRNDHGIMVSTHILFNDWDWHGSGTKSIPLYKIPFLVLSNLKSIDDIETELQPILDNVATSPILENNGYLAQFVVTDGTTTYALLPPESNEGSYEIVDISSNPKLTNFRWVEDETVTRAQLQDRPTGVERWNLIPCDLKDLRFTKAYESPNRLSEFIGIHETTKESTDEELLAIYDLAREAYLDRKRDGKTWQTMHSVVYSGKRVEELYAQEDWDVSYSGGSSTVFWDDVENKPESYPPESHTHDDRYYTSEEVEIYVDSSIASAIGGAIDGLY